MELTTSFDLSTKGDKTFNPYTGSFKIKTLLSRKEHFMADKIRRELLGDNPEAAMPTLVGEAFMLGQLRVRVIEAPKWFTDADYGQEFVDTNLIPEIFELCMKKAKEMEDKLSSQAEKARIDLIK